MKCIPLRLFLLLILVYSISLVSCGQQVKTHKPVDSLAQDMDKTIPGNFTQHSTDVFDSTSLTPFFKKYPGLKTYAGQVTDFYQKRKYAYAWFENGSLIEQAGNLTNRIMNLDNDGIYKKAPYAKSLDSLLDGLNTKTTSKQPLTDVELMLTSQYFMLANLIWHGMGADASKSAKWFLPREKDSYDQYLDSLLKTPTKQLTNEPVYRQYELLRTYLKKYRDLDSSDKWALITIAGKSVKSGDSSSTILLIKKRLYKLGDYKGDTITNVFTAELVSGVKQFQTRLGLPVNGLVNRETINEMNVPLKSRIKQILVNMERSRWLPASMKGDYLGVNIPEFKLHVYNNDSLLWSCNVVVGKSANQTTVFYGEVKYVVFSPYWNVPESIVRNEVIPGMRKNANYISKHNMQITGYVNGLPSVRQKPGPENSLGLVKFLFPNSYSIYLHDTPSKSLFGESARAFSHGCIRVKEPAKLADFLLQQRKEWTPQKIAAAMHAGKEQYVTLNNKIPVFIAYLTAFVDRDGKINFRKDIYNLDGRLADMLMKQNGAY